MKKILTIILLLIGINTYSQVHTRTWSVNIATLHGVDTTLEFQNYGNTPWSIQIAWTSVNDSVTADIYQSNNMLNYDEMYSTALPYTGIIGSNSITFENYYSFTSYRMKWKITKNSATQGIIRFTHIY